MTELFNKLKKEFMDMSKNKLETKEYLFKFNTNRFNMNLRDFDISHFNNYLKSDALDFLNNEERYSIFDSEVNIKLVDIEYIDLKDYVELEFNCKIILDDDKNRIVNDFNSAIEMFKKQYLNTFLFEVTTNFDYIPSLRRFNKEVDTIFYNKGIYVQNLDVNNLEIDDLQVDINSLKIEEV